MIARDPSDDLFLEAIGAGGFGILWKPLTSEKLISAIHLARSCAEAHLARAGHAQIHN
jgi:AmiR/NasT family two-component response regulator